MSAINTMLKRRDLIGSFDKYRDYSVIAVCAPAGYGKTVAVTQWLESDTRAKAFFPIDEYDNSFTGFCERFCRALHDCQPQNQTLGDIIHHPYFRKAPDEFTLRAISALSGKKRAVLVIDDLNLICDSAILQFLPVIIKRLPKNFQIVLLSRHELPLDLSDLWLKGQIARINADQFLFASEDIKALYKKRGSNITDEQAREISQKTQGWAIGINALMLSGGSQSSDRVYDYLDEFLRANIWERWDDATREFMLCTAYLRVLTPSLCDELTGRSDSGRLLEDLTKKGAFITQQEGGTYIYHNLFRQFLRRMVQECGEDFLTSLLKKEGHWHLSRKDFHNAVNCFIQCKDHDGIAKCFNTLDYSKRQDLLASRLLLVVKNPEVEKVMRKFPYLLLLIIWRAFAEGRKDDMVAFIDEYYAKYPEIIAKYPTRAHEMFYVRVLDFRAPANKMMGGGKLLTKVLSKLMSKTMTPSTIRRWVVPMETPTFHRGIRDFSDVAIGDCMANCDNIIKKVGWVFGDEQDMVAGIAKAEIMYEQGNLEEANVHALAAVAEVKSHFPPELTFCAMAILVCVLDALGRKDSEEAAAAFNSISEMIDDNMAYHLVHNFSAFAARREMAVGNIKAAENWLDEKAFEVPVVYKMYSDITTCRALILTEKYDSAIISLNRILKIAYDFNRPLDIIEAQILLAIAYWKKKYTFRNEALEHLEEAVWKAHKYGIVQMFVNDGTNLAGMLYKLMNRAKQQNKDADKPLSFIKLLHLKTRQKVETKGEAMKSDVKYTKKQIAVMELLCQGKTYKEMAELLGIKQSTLRSHLELIYSKLEVTNMMDAVAKINALGLLK